MKLVRTCIIATVVCASSDVLYYYRLSYYYSSNVTDARALILDTEVCEVLCCIRRSNYYSNSITPTSFYLQKSYSSRRPVLENMGFLF